jgi:hypothetical protein
MASERPVKKREGILASHADASPLNSVGIIRYDDF